MKLYSLSANDIATRDEGETDLPRILERFESCYAEGLKHFDQGEEALAATTFGICRTAIDYLEVSCNGHDSILIHTDRLIFPSFLSRIFCAKRRLTISGSRDTALKTITDYCALDRATFEERYSGFSSR